MSKTDDQLRGEISINEARAEWGAWAIVIGLVFEVVIAEFEPEAAECRRRINKLLADHGKSASDILELLDIVRKGKHRRSHPQHRRHRPAIRSPASNCSKGCERFSKNSSVSRNTNTPCSRCGACMLTFSAASCTRRG